MVKELKIEFKILNKEAVKDLIKTEVCELSSRKDFDQKLRELRKENYILEFQPVKVKE